MLCDICRTIPFKEIHDGIDVDDEGWALGTLPELQERQHCDFCSFILKVTYDKRVVGSTGLSLKEKKAIILKWRSGGGYFTVDSSDFGSVLRFMSGDWTGGTGRDVTGNYIEVDIIKAWLQRCQAEHVDKCPPAPLEGIAYEHNLFRFIDVQRLCIVQTSALPSYVALSYVWGQTRNFRLRKKNQSHLMEDLGLHKQWDKIPLTIQDAIWLVYKMGITYLWVDSLCLVQDDKDDIASGIQMMDVIYEQSLFTIVAAGGTDANSGLPGVRNKLRTASQVTCKVSPGIRLLLTQEIEATLKPTKYSTRAWTFQEFILSRRRVIFINGMVYFHCREGSWEEEVHGLYTRNNNATLLFTLPLDSEIFDSCDIFHNLIFYYSTREAALVADYLAAMAGLFQRLGKKMKCKLLCGVPVASFDLNLLFSSVSSTQLKRRREFPSWSWAGWSGHLTYQVQVRGDKNDWLVNNTWIIWYKRSPSGVVSLVWDPAAHDTPGDVSYTRRQGFPRGLGLDNVSTARLAPSWDLAPGTTLPSYPVLQFWTMAVYYKLRRAQDSKHSRSLYELYDSSESCCGYLTGDNLFPCMIDDKPVELIMLSNDGPRVDFLRVDDTGDRYWAMWIEWKNGVAERKDLVRIHYSNLAKSFRPGPLWKEVLLA